ncbi:MAG: T9SS type A sorting domain-containing protein [Saprospiraceae bacterium]|nr:T9SS type A sorting domain-containing protein [Saprospiraceae bacterium]
MKFIIKILIIAYCLLPTAYFSFSQNLVQNGSLEEYYNCPYSSTQLDFAKGWFAPWGGGGISEYFYACATNYSFKVPKHGSGFQYAKYGKAYCGFSMFNPNSNWREYAATALSYELKANEKFCISFFVSLANFTNYGIEDIGIYFSYDTVQIEHIIADTINPQLINTNGIISDTLNWVEISGTYIAKGGEKFITIGNFNVNRPTNYLKVYFSGGAYNYYYVDNVSVYPCNAPVYAAECGIDKVICLGDSIQLGTHKIEQYEYFWFAFGNKKDTLSKLAKPYFSPDTTTTYILKVLDFKFDWSADTVTIKVVECGKPTKLNVYPNPTYGELILEFNKPILSQTSISFYNMLGQKIQSFSLQSNAESKSAKVNLSGLASGLYFYQVEIEGEESFKGKIVLLR